jgi:hypothetical protein
MEIDSGEPRMIPDQEQIHDFTPSDFAPKGSVKLADSVLDEARAFQRDLQNYDPAAKWIVAFTWCYQRLMRKSGESQYVDEGPGLDLAGYRSTELPDYAVEIQDSVPLAFIIRPDILAASQAKQIVKVTLSSGRQSFGLV